MKGLVAFLLFLSLAAANFAYQFMSGEPNWRAATERSYFQGVALFCYWLSIRFIVK